AYRYFILLPKYKNGSRYTIGKVISAKIKMKGSIYDIKYEYVKNGRKHVGNSSQQIHQNPREIIDRKYVVLYLLNSTNNEILLDHPISDTTKSVPYYGWTKIP